jgi:hypothetical protein
MNAPLPVRIVRPKAKASDIAPALITGAVMLAIRAWIVMLLAPLVGLTPGYWLTLGVVYGVRVLIGADTSGYKAWTSAR